MRDGKKAEEIAALRMQLLSPLLAEGLDIARARQIKARICEQTGMSERTLRRYLVQYRNDGFNGLKPQGKKRDQSEAVPAKILDQAILLRREVPGRSVAQIIQILEWEGLALPGEIKRSTLQEKLSERGYSSRLMRLYADTGVAARRYHRKALKYLDPETIASAFLHSEERKVDKAGCISFNGKKYEVGLNLIGSKVEVVYDPADTSVLTIECEGHEIAKAKPLVIGESSGKRPKLPEHLLPAPAESSRLLQAAAKKNQERKEVTSPAVSYRKVRKEGGDHV